MVTRSRKSLIIFAILFFLFTCNADEASSDTEAENNNLVLDLFENQHNKINEVNLTKKPRKIKRKRKKLLPGRGEKKEGEQQENQGEWLHFLQEKSSSNINQIENVLQASAADASEDRSLNNSERRQAKLRYELHSSQQIRGLEFHAKEGSSRHNSFCKLFFFFDYYKLQAAPHFPKAACYVLQSFKAVGRAK